jgi:hypothetical protein
MTRFSATTLLDDGPNIGTETNRLWASQNAYQATCASQGSSETSSDQSSLIRGFKISSSCRNDIVTQNYIKRTPNPESLDSSMHSDSLSLSISNNLPNPLPSDPARRRDCLPSKEESNRATIISHHIMDHVKAPIHKCADSIKGPVSDELLQEADLKCHQLFTSLASCNRHVQLVMSRKKTLEDELGNLGSRIKMLCMIIPQADKEPLLYDTSKLSAAMNIFCFSIK